MMKEKRNDLSDSQIGTKNRRKGEKLKEEMISDMMEETIKTI